jgi:hypothetical protein
MKFLENFNLGKYNLILFGILFVFMFHQYWYISNISKSTMQIKYKQTEHMSNISNDIKEAVKQVYLADVESIRNLSEVATKLQANGLTIPGNLTVNGQIKCQSLDALNTKIDSVNSSLTNNINTNNTTNNNSINSLQGQIQNINSNFNNYVKYSDNIRITNRGTGKTEYGEPFIGVCGAAGTCPSKINVTMVADPDVTTFKIVRP